MIPLKQKEEKNIEVSRRHIFLLPHKMKRNLLLLAQETMKFSLEIHSSTSIGNLSKKQVGKIYVHSKVHLNIRTIKRTFSKDICCSVQIIDFYVN
jgi:hypothetical protein